MIRAKPREARSGRHDGDDRVAQNTVGAAAHNVCDDDDLVVERRDGAIGSAHSEARRGEPCLRSLELIGTRAQGELDRGSVARTSATGEDVDHGTIRQADALRQTKKAAQLDPIAVVGRADRLDRNRFGHVVATATSRRPRGSAEHDEKRRTEPPARRVRPRPLAGRDLRPGIRT